MLPNKSGSRPATPDKRACCHCCDKCYPRTTTRLNGKCGICSKLHRKCPFGLDVENAEEPTVRPNPIFNSARPNDRNIDIEPSTTTIPRPSSAQRHPVVNSPMVRSYHRSIVGTPARVVQQVYQPVYPIIEIQPVYYNVSVPIRISDFKGHLTNSTVIDTQPNQRDTSMIGRQFHATDKMKHSTSTFDRSKMKLSLLESRQKGRDGPIHPDELRSIFSGLGEA